MTDWLREGKALVQPPADDPYGLEPSAGRELDALVAEKVLHHTVTWLPTALLERVPHYADSDIAKGYLVLPRYSTDIAAAWLVVEKLKDAATAWTLANYGNEWHVKVKRIDEYGKKVFYGESAEQELPLAICLAALKAVDARARASGSSDRE